MTLTPNKFSATPTADIPQFSTDDDLVIVGRDNGNRDVVVTADAERQQDPRYVKAKELREYGVKVKDICRRCGISMSTYYQWFPNPHSKRMLDAQNGMIADIKRMRETMTDAAIARHFKRTRQWVWITAGPREKSQRKKKVYLRWETTPHLMHEVEKVAIRAGAAQGDWKLSIGSMLDMIANGDLIVTAPRRKRIADAMEPEPSN